MKIASVLTLVSAFALLALNSQAAPLDEAHRAFADGNFRASTQGYEAVLAHDGYSAPVLFDLGNSYYREGNLAPAILAYKRAQSLAPGDPDIAANLTFAQKQAGLIVVAPGWIDNAAHMLSASKWAWVACGAWTLLCLSLLARTAFPQRRPAFAAAGVLSAFVLFDAIVAIVLSSGELREAVVMDKNASALISPFPAAQVVFSPAAGETVTLHKAYDDFLLVSDRSGHTGWISKTQIAPVIPPPSVATKSSS